MSATRDPIDSMAPWDAVPYFQPPKETLITIQNGVITPVCLADPQRVALVIGTTQFSSVSISTNPNMNATMGFNITSSQVPIQFLFAEVGPLVQMAWFAFGTGFTTMTVWEVTLAKWPRLKSPLNGARNANTARSKNSNRNGR